MTRIAKLYTRAAANPAGLSFREFERLLAAFGFIHARTVGSYRNYVHATVAEILTILPAGKDAKAYQVRRLLDLVDRYALSIIG